MSAATKTNGRAPRVPLAAAPERAAAQTAGTPALDAAVLAVQGKASKLTPNADGQIQHRTYRYVTLTALTDEVLPLLVEQALLWRTFPTALEDGSPALRYRMTHVPSGESDEDVMGLPCERTMQALGSAVTYARRYALVAYLQLTVEDDDGQSANLPAPVDRYADAQAAHEALNSAPGGEEPRTVCQPNAKAPQRSERRVTANQRTKLLEPRAKKVGLSDGQFANVILAAAGEPPRVWRSEAHASQTKDRLLQQLPARLKDAVLAGIAQAAAEGSQA